MPLANDDIDRLATRGYGQGELNKLHGFRAALVAEVAGRNQRRSGGGRRSMGVSTDTPVSAAGR